MAANSTVVEVKDRSGESILLHYVDGIYYPAYALGPEAYTKRLSDVRNMEVYPNDVITSGFLRSGNHWVYEIVHMLTNKTTQFHDKNMIRESLVDCFSEERMEEFAKEPPPRHIHAHFNLTRLWPKLPEVRPKLIYTIRNPKDVYVSLYNFSTEVKKGIHYEGTWEDFLQLVLDGNFIYGGWFDHVLAIEKFQQDYPDCPVFIFCFEKMKENPVEEIKKLAQYLELEAPQDLVENIAQATFFANMRPHITKGKSAIEDGKKIEDIFKEGASGIYRKGDVGDWRNWFTEAQSANFNKIFESKMAGSKLGSLVRPYIV